MRRLAIVWLAGASCSIPTELNNNNTTTVVTLGAGAPRLVDFQPGLNVYEICVGSSDASGSITIENASEGTLQSPTTVALTVAQGDAGPTDCPTMTAKGDPAVAWSRFRWSTASGTGTADVRFINGSVTTAPLNVALDGSRFLGYAATVDKNDTESTFTRYDLTLKYLDPATGMGNKVATGVTFQIITLPMATVEYPMDEADLVTGPTGTTTIIIGAPTETTEVDIKPQGGDLLLVGTIQPTSP